MRKIPGWIVTITLIFIIVCSIGIYAGLRTETSSRTVVSHGFTSGVVIEKRFIQNKYPAVYVEYVNPITLGPCLELFYVKLKEMMLYAIDQKVTMEWWLFRDGGGVEFKINLVQDLPAESRFVRSEDGIASWYGHFFHGKTMANGRRFDMNVVTVAHKTLPLGTRVIVINLLNNKWVEAKVTDRGPYKPGRIVDVSYAAAKILGMVHHGIVPVRVVKC